MARAAVDLPNVRLFRRPAGGTLKLERGDWIRTGLQGQADLYAIAKGGRHYEIECKNVGGSLSEAQARWREWCAVWGVPWLLLEVRKGEVPPETIHRWMGEFRVFTSPASLP